MGLLKKTRWTSNCKPNSACHQPASQQNMGCNTSWQAFITVFFPIEAPGAKAGVRGASIFSLKYIDFQNIHEKATRNVSCVFKPKLIIHNIKTMYWNTIYMYMYYLQGDQKVTDSGFNIKIYHNWPIFLLTIHNWGSSGVVSFTREGHQFDMFGPP